MRDYTVITYPPPPAKRDSSGGGSRTRSLSPPRVVDVKLVNSPQEAAEKAGVQPGGRALVVIEARGFTRAEKAPLEATDANFQPLPIAATP
jgi:hypothetical protein